jgi:uncharacterized protein YbjT (DUF2867 family)
MKAVIAGATGLVGSHVVQKLVESSQLSEVIAITRRPLDIKHAKLKHIIVEDFSQITKVPADYKNDIYICCLGTTIKDAGSQEDFRKVDFAAILEFGKLAKAHDARSFVLISAMGADPKSSIFYNRVKGETEVALEALNIRSLTIFQPGLLIGDRIKLRRGEKFAIGVFRLLSPILPARLQKMVATQVDHLANRMIEVGLEAQPGTRIISARNI